MPLPKGTQVTGIGMNEDELKANEAYTEWKVYDLNEGENQEWTWLKEDSLDLVICTVSIDYLIYPLAVLKESYRLLKPGTLHPPARLSS
jgi:ubiquinone/menaquinone biosynthesis C-methylase UbiE